MKSSSVKSIPLKGFTQTLMGRFKKLMQSRRRRAAYTRVLLLGVLSLWMIIGLVLPAQRKTAKAAEVELARASNPWSFASFPVENFQAYTSPFGYRQSPYGGEQFHYGLDIAAPLGSYIRNWWEGHVVEISDDSACGTSVVIESGEWLHIYCHMQGYVSYEEGRRVMVDPDGNIRIREGANIGTGQPIGRVGMTGRTTGPHLHWGLKFENSWVDPAMVLRAMYDDQQAIR
ncbi:metalloendopeptidase-like membrane protein [Leptolyngbya sp. PCC 7375]|nr:metalloendopeptidase-like membrane protein [Leptolyngbya sp. PCC 7375]